MRSMALACVLCLGLAPASWADDKAKEPPAAAVKELQGLLEEFANLQKKTDEAFQEARTPAQREKIVKDFRQDLSNLGQRFAALAEKHPKTSVAFDAWSWIIYTGLPGPESEKAVKALLADHARYFGVLAENLQDSELPTAEALFRGILAHDEADKAARGLATLSLARLLKTRAEASENPEAVKLRAEAEALFTDIVKNHKDNAKLAEAAEPELFELQNLVVGKTAPEIEGEDGAGKKLKLSDFRGKVVVIDFWASWCGPCMGLVPHTRELVKRLEGKPFVFLGVNADDSRQRQQKAEEQHKMTWRSWFDGRQGPIASRWNIRYLPTLYVLDHEGVIRHKIIGGGNPKQLDEAVEALLKQVK